MHPKPKHPRLIPLLRLLRHQGRIDLVEDVGEGGTEVGAVDLGVAAGFGVVEIFAAGAVEFYGLDVGVVGHSRGEEGVGCAEDAGAFAEVAFFVFVELRQTERKMLGLAVDAGRNMQRKKKGGERMGLDGWGREGDVTPFLLDRALW